MLSREITENFKNRFAFAWPTYCGAIERVRSLTPVCYYALFIASVHNALERVNCNAIINNITVICTANAELCVSFMSSLHNILLKVNKLLVIYIKGKFCGIWSTATQTTESPLNLPGSACVKCIALLKYFALGFSRCKTRLLLRAKLFLAKKIIYRWRVDWWYFRYFKKYYMCLRESSNFSNNFNNLLD